MLPLCRAVVCSNTFVSIDISVYCDVLLLRECGVNVDTFNTLSLTERQEEKMQIAENNWVRRICKVTHGDRNKMKELREEIGIKNI